MDKEKDSMERCDRCRKWSEKSSLGILPERLHPILETNNEFSVCMDCINNYSIEQWTEWIPIARKYFKEKKRA
ncbi:hypothetical protein K8O68_11160 [Salipaludibacillus sp. CUR1]|uniref:hypothetical protein n=1 Tax=Salipaludibacillus sp. CUR1 TaxID=2820003 RepID=UPI001E3E5B47|nr:hypothetical protein [Salipaludibacillus sp. CUR1]MCE7792975.1 hypothetical protein [Salipaludibacillus sp. CUR1]